MKKFKLFSCVVACLLSLHVSAVPRPMTKPVAINIITNERGEKLYVLELDSNNEVTCYGECTRDWPEIQIEKTKQARYKGQVQVTVNNKPLNYFDQGPQATTEKTEDGLGVWRIKTPSKY